VNIRIIPYRAKRRLFLEYSIVRFFLLAMDSGSNLTTGDASLINEIRGHEYRILVIDDDKDFRKSFCFKLKRKYKAQVEDVGSGEAGVEKLRIGNSYDFIFTDIMMDGMTGIETYFELRKINGEVRIVLMSAYSDSKDWEKAQELKDVPLLHKPISDDQLVKVLGA
jgi:CheY-like chemotaxis protein